MATSWHLETVIAREAGTFFKTASFSKGYSGYQSDILFYIIRIDNDDMASAYLLPNHATGIYGWRRHAHRFHSKIEAKLFFREFRNAHGLGKVTLQIEEEA